MNQKLIRRHDTQVLLQTVLVFGAMALLLAALGGLFFGGQGALWAFVIAGVVIGMTPRVSPRWLLRALGARPIHPLEAPDLHELASVLAQRAGLAQVPQLHLASSPAMNAAAVGNREDAAIVVTDSLLRGLSARQCQGVLAHEIGHIQNGDTGLMMVAEVVRRVTHALSTAGLVLLFLALLFGASLGLTLMVPLMLIGAPIASRLLLLALSRSREFAADLAAVRLTQDPVGLASALERLQRDATPFWWRVFGIEPRERIPEVLRSHPSTRERVRRLHELAASQDQTGPAAVRPTMSASPRSRQMRRTSSRNDLLLHLLERLGGERPVRISSAPRIHPLDCHLHVA